jgi:aspartyl-tRNA synthetase
MAGALSRVHMRQAGRCWPLSRSCHQKLAICRASAAASTEQTDAQADVQAGFSTIASTAMSWPSRTHGAGTLREADVGKQITVCGWVDRNRNLGGLGFVDVRDHTGLLQVSGSHMMWDMSLPAH